MTLINDLESCHYPDLEVLPHLRDGALDVCADTGDPRHRLLQLASYAAVVVVVVSLDAHGGSALDQLEKQFNINILCCTMIL